MDWLGVMKLCSTASCTEGEEDRRGETFSAERDVFDPHGRDVRHRPLSVAAGKGGSRARSARDVLEYAICARAAAAASQQCQIVSPELRPLQQWDRGRPMPRLIGLTQRPS